MTDDPAACPWSSCASHCNQLPATKLTPHPAYTALDSTTKTRAEAYRHLLRETLSDDDVLAI